VAIDDLLESLVYLLALREQLVKVGVAKDAAQRRLCDVRRRVCAMCDVAKLKATILVTAASGEKTLN
jgi:hypothetical protein